MVSFHNHTSHAALLPLHVSYVSASAFRAAGPCCNHYFLKRLAAIGRGMNDVAFRPHAIQAVMERMLAAAAMPMLSDVQIRVQVGVHKTLGNL